MTTTLVPQEDLRARALRQLKKKRDLQGHAIVYLLVNTCLVVIWAMTSPGGFFWPMFVMAFWGVGLVMNAWDVYRVDDFQDAEVEREMRHLAGRS